MLKPEPETIVIVILNIISLKQLIMKRFTIFGVFLLSVLTSFGQMNLNGFTPKSGIYKSLEELKNNTPSAQLSYRTFSSSMAGVMYQHLDVDKSVRKEVGRVMAFSDGNRLFVNFNNPRIRRCTGFCEVEKIGNLS